MQPQSSSLPRICGAIPRFEQTSDMASQAPGADIKQHLKTLIAQLPLEVSTQLDLDKSEYLEKYPKLIMVIIEWHRIWNPNLLKPVEELVEQINAVLLPIKNYLSAVNVWRENFRTSVQTSKQIEPLLKESEALLSELNDGEPLIDESYRKTEIQKMILSDLGHACKSENGKQITPFFIALTDRVLSDKAYKLIWTEVNELRKKINAELMKKDIKECLSSAFEFVRLEEYDLATNDYQRAKGIFEELKEQGYEYPIINEITRMFDAHQAECKELGYSYS
jgi:hypothetical protein